MTQTGLNDYLFDAMREEASELHVTVGLPPVVRVKGEVRPLDYEPLTANATRGLIFIVPVFAAMFEDLGGTLPCRPGWRWASPTCLPASSAV